MRKIIFASLVAIAAAAPIASAFAGSDRAGYEDGGIQTVMINHHAMKVHVMKMDNGTIIYGMTREDLARLNAKWLAESRDH